MDIKDFAAMVVSEEKGNLFRKEVVSRSIGDLPAGDVLIQVLYSSLNYKDALSASGNKGVTKEFPHTPGIDSVGKVVISNDPNYQAGDNVICMGYDLGMNTWGGFSQFIRVPARWVHPLPDAISPLQAMQLGTAGFTAAQCVDFIESSNSEVKSNGPVLVTGATGGVGLISIMLLSQLGYEVHALTGKNEAAALLVKAGAAATLTREQGMEGADKILLKEKWSGVVDTVGGQVLVNAIKATKFDGVITSCGNALSGDIPLTVYPFILRGVLLKGIYSANCPMAKRLKIWEQLSSKYDLSTLELFCSIISLHEVDGAVDSMLNGLSSGRKVISLWEDQ